MSWKEVLKPSLNEYGPVESLQAGSSTSSRLSDGPDSLYESSDKLCCALDCLPGPSGSSSSYDVVCSVDEWLKNRTESLSSMDMEQVLKNDSIDTNFLMNDSNGANKDNPVFDHFLSPKDLCISNDSSSRKRLSDLSEDLNILNDDLNVKNKFMIGGKDENLCRRGSWTDGLELTKDKSNTWESISNTSQRSHDLEKDVDFADFNSFDPLCSIELPVVVDGKDLGKGLVIDEDLSVIQNSSSLANNQSKNDPLLPSMQDSLDIKNSKDALLLEEEEIDGDLGEKKESAVIISSNKQDNTTHIVIKTSQNSQQTDVSQNQNEKIIGPSTSEKENNSDKKKKLDLIKIEKNDFSDEVEDEQPLIDALFEIGVKIDSLVYITTPSGQKMWICPEKDCGKTYPRQSMLKIHILGHYSLRPYKCDFEGCYWSFYTYFKLKRHKATHLKKKDFACNVEGCGRKFTTIYNLNTHLKLHGRPAEMVCPVEGCGCSFQTKRRLENHMKDHDACHAPYRCPYCNNGYYSNNSLHSHMKSHEHKEDDIKCQWEGCGKLFDKPCRLKAHMRCHTGDRPYSCSFQGCSWSFSSASKLKRHQSKHTDERKFVCHVNNCKKAFLRPEHLREHLSTHGGNKNFVCPLEGCGVKFTAKSSLYVHMKKHQDPQQEKAQYVCKEESCGKKYLCRSSLKHHVQKCHTQNPRPELLQISVDPTIAFMACDDEQDMLLDGNTLVAGDTEAILEPEQNVVLSTINPADLMLTSTGLGAQTMTNHILPAPEDSSEEESSCARTNLPLPLVPRRHNLLPPATLLSDDLFSDPILQVSSHSTVIEFPTIMQRDFPVSTINLRDLE